MTNLMHNCLILQYVYYVPLHVSSIICSKHVEEHNTRIVKSSNCASSWSLPKSPTVFLVCECVCLCVCECVCVCVCVRVRVTECDQVQQYPFTPIISAQKEARRRQKEQLTN